MQTVVVQCVNLPPPPLCYLKYGKAGRAQFDHVSMKQLGRGGGGGGGGGGEGSLQ